MDIEKNDVIINMDTLKARLFDELATRVSPDNETSTYYRLLAYSEVINILEEYNVDPEVV